MSWYIVFTLFLFFLLRLPSLFEPHWYGDEGIYQAVGIAINNGSLLYKDIWDNKPPLLYLVYALFQSDQFTVRLVSLIFGLLSIPVFFLLSKKLFAKPLGSTKIYFFTTSIFALLFGLPILEGNIANAENFMMLPILISALLIFEANQPFIHSRINKGKFYGLKFSIFIAGLLLGLAFLFKIVAVFDFLAFVVFFFILSLPPKLNLSLHKERKYLLSFVQKTFPFVVGFLIPILATIFYFWANGAFFDFAKATFSSNIGYVGWQNKWIFPQGLLLLKTILLIMLVILITRKRGVLAKNTIFILLWFVFSLFNAFFSERPYTHYLLVLLPSFSLMLGSLFWEKNNKKLLVIIFIIAFILVIKNFNFYGKTTTYYQNFTSFLLGQKSVSSYRAFFDKRTLVDYEIAMFVRSKIQKSDSIFVWGNNAQLYKMTESIPHTKYIVVYHITGNKDGLVNTREVIERTKPKFIIIMPGQAPIPFILTHYSERFNINNILIYEFF